MQVFLTMWLLFLQQESNPLGISFDAHKNPARWAELYKQVGRFAKSHINATRGVGAPKPTPRIWLNPLVT